MSFKQINVAGVDFALFEDFGVFPATIDAESNSIIECAEQKLFSKLIVHQILQTFILRLCVILIKIYESVLYTMCEYLFFSLLLNT